VFNFRRFVALFGAPRTPYDAALRDLEQGRPERALAVFEAMLQTETSPPARAQLENKRGVALVRLERRAEAASAFEAALENAPFSPALVNLGNLAFEAGATDAAMDFYRRAVECDPQNASAHRHLALAYRRSGREPEAYESFRRARRLEVRPAGKQSRRGWPIRRSRD